MKKIVYLFAVALLALNGCRPAQKNGWVTLKADDRISLQFPSEPKQLTPGSYAVTGKDSVAYVFTLVDLLKAAGIDSVTLAPIKGTPLFASQMKTGLKKTLPDVTLDDFKISTWKGFTSYTTSGFDSKKKRYDLFMFIAGNDLYSFTTITGNGAGLGGRDKFFGSVKVSPH